MQLQRGGALEVAMGGQPSYVVKAVAEDVKPFETLSQLDLMSASGVGSLIHATVGSFGGTGRRWRNLAGLAA